MRERRSRALPPLLIAALLSVTLTAAPLVLGVVLAPASGLAVFSLESAEAAQACPPTCSPPPASEGPCGPTPCQEPPQQTPCGDRPCTPPPEERPCGNQACRDDTSNAPPPCASPPCGVDASATVAPPTTAPTEQPPASGAGGGADPPQATATPPASTATTTPGAETATTTTAAGSTPSTSTVPGQPPLNFDAGAPSGGSSLLGNGSTSTTSVGERAIGARGDDDGDEASGFPVPVVVLAVLIAAGALALIVRRKTAAQWH